MRIKYFLNFKEEKRVSMEEYADHLIEYQKKNYKDIDIQFFRPKLDNISRILYFKKIKFRYSRYISYPKQIKNLPISDIAHVCDHSYAHLYSSIKSKVKFVTVHDLVPFKFHKEIGRWPYLSAYSLSKLKYFNQVFTVSENTKRDVLKYTDCPESKIQVISEVVEDLFNNLKIDEFKICEKYNLPKAKKKILISGSNFYKNITTAFKVLEKLIKRDDDIVFVKIGGKPDLKDFSHLKNKIYALPFIERNELPNIYKICRLLLFPSTYEGFGRPLLEAMKCGLPVVCSDNSAIPEVVGNSALMSNCENVDDFTNNILKLINDNEFYKLKQKEGLERSKLFDVDTFHQKLIAIYKNELNSIN